MLTPTGLFQRQLAGMDAGRFAPFMAWAADAMEAEQRLGAKRRPPERSGQRGEFLQAFAQRIAPIVEELRKVERVVEHHRRRRDATPTVPSGMDPGTFKFWVGVSFRHMRDLGTADAGAFAVAAAEKGDPTAVRALELAPRSRPLAAPDYVERARDALYRHLHPGSWEDWKAAEAVATSVRADLQRLVATTAGWA